MKKLPSCFYRKEIESFLFKRISSAEAMAMIDENKTSELYFVEIYYESKKVPYGSNGSYIKCCAPNEIVYSTPFKYHEPVIIETGKFFKPYKEILAEPKKVIRETPYIRYDKHVWLVRDTKIENVEL